MKRETRKVSAHTALSRRILALSLGLWLLAMFLLTWSVAGDMYKQLESKLFWYIYNPVRRDYEENALPGKMEYEMLDDLDALIHFVDVDQVLPIVGSQWLKNHVSGDDWIWGKWDLFYGVEFAIAYYIEDTEPLIHTGNWLSFQYTRDENWYAQDIEPKGYGYVDLTAIDGGPEAFRGYFSNFYGGDKISHFVNLLRITGYFEGNEFHPTVIDLGSYLDYNGWEHDLAALARLDTRNRLEWETLVTAEAPEGRELETIFAFHVNNSYFEDHPVTVNGQRYDRLPDVLRADCRSWREYVDTGDYDRYQSQEKESLWDAVLIERSSQEDGYGEYTLAIALRCKPMQYAFIRLLPCYLVTLAVLAAILYFLLRGIRQNLTKPLEEMATAAAIGTAVTPMSEWGEPAALEAYVNQTREALAQSQADIRQLNASLDYARNAEENRRQLVSNITHELKTPLAVIHSYAEGLQAGIAGEKRQQYLSVIQEEAERMDAMVLQMLDLSRLEAGRVRLSAEAFSLIALTKSIVDRLSPMAQAKELNVYFGFEEEFLLPADESRIGQAITNLMTNAIKYTPQGGDVRINVYIHKGCAHFTVENTAPHLSPEALEKVWDSFYRADPSRTTPGTGLGLTLVKTIVELHRGKCTVRNTVNRKRGEAVTAVEFGFTLPLG